MYKIIGGDGQEYGPVSLAQLQQWRAEGRVNNQTLIQPAGSTDWKSLNDIPELAAPTPAPPSPPASPVPASPAKTSGWAITSLVLGILGFLTCGVTALPGLILGIVGLNKINKSGSTLGGKGLAIAGVVVSGVVLLMLPIWAALMIPAFSNARGKAKQAACMSNLKQIGLGFAMYADDNQGRLPTNNWSDAVLKYVNTEKVFRCPSGHAERCSYAFNANMAGQEWQGDLDVVLLIDAPLGWNGLVAGPQAVPASPHKKVYNVLFNDGHVEIVMLDRLKQLKWKPEPKPK